MKVVNQLISNVYLNYRVKKFGQNELYYIQMSGGVSGFFAILRVALDYCCYADEHGFIPYIVYGRNMLYFEKPLFLGTNNPYEYYYEQPFRFSLSSIIKGMSFVRCKSEHSDEVEFKYNLKPFSYIVEESYIEKMADIYRKYIHLNARTDKRIKSGIEKVLKEKHTLGLHIRGTDFYKEFNNHPIPVTVDEYIEAVNEEILEKHYEQIFVATDDLKCLEELKRKVDIPLIYYKSTMRASGNKSVACERSERKNNNYLLGYEVLRDVYTLAACEGFIGCLSQVDIFVQIIKRSRGQKFLSLKIIDKGVFKNNRQCWEPSK